MKTSSPSRTSRLLLAALLPLAFAAVLAPVSSAHADTGKPTTTETQQRAALRAELQRLLTARGLGKGGVDRVLANLDQLDMAALRDLAGFAGERATGADRLLVGGAAGARDRAGEFTGRTGTGSNGNPASQNATDRAMTPGVRDTRGQTSSCAACPGAPKETPVQGTKQRNGADMLKPEQSASTGGPRTINAANGDTITLHKDGSAKIQRPNGTNEYLDSDHRLVDSAGQAKEPMPDDAGSSGAFTAADVRRIGAMLGKYSQPAGTDEGGGTGGPVDQGKTNPTGSRGLYTDAQLGAGYVSRADLEEIVRVAIEKLQGPQGR